MKLFFIAFALVACTRQKDRVYTSRYVVTTPDNSGQMLYVYHTDSVNVDGNGASFIPKEDSTKIYTLKNFNIETTK